jgi:hypothetical protein
MDEEEKSPVASLVAHRSLRSDSHPRVGILSETWNITARMSSARISAKYRIDTNE